MRCRAIMFLLCALSAPVRHYGLSGARLVMRAHASTSASPSHPLRIAVVGGGASGFFASIAAAESSGNARVTVLEATSKTLQKVKISGGGRCNVMHDTNKPTPEILASYPRGQRELNGLLTKRFTPNDARSWFESRNVQLKTEPDGRMFPVTDSSQTILDALTDAAESAGVNILTRHKVESIEKGPNAFTITYKDGSIGTYDAVILATGSSPAGFALAKSLGHDLVPAAPSLFTLNSNDQVKEGGFLYGLSGVSVPTARVTLNKKLQQEGPLLITHHGVSGPAVLRLSAFAAREFQDIKYKGQVSINWDTRIGSNEDEVFHQLWKLTQTNPKRTVAGACPLPENSIPRRLWSSLCSASECSKDLVWGNASKKVVRKLAGNIVSFSLPVTGKGTFKEEFVTAGGIPLKEIDMKTMGSKKCPGLFACGEVINVDGVTGGFNFLNCWGTGFVAGTSSAEYCARLATGNLIESNSGA